MTTVSTENRECERIPVVMIGTVSVLDKSGKKTVSSKNVKTRNVSLSGCSLAADNSLTDHIHNDSDMSIQLNFSEDRTHELEGKIVWLRLEESANQIVLGIEFKTIPPEIKQKIIKIMEYRRERINKGQTRTWLSSSWKKLKRVVGK